MRRNIVLIDFESVQPESLAALLDEHFEVLLFVGANQTKLSFELVTAVQTLGERGRYVKMAGNGPNALDFHIAYYIGRLAAEDPGAFFHVISRDKGFDPLIAHLKSNRILAGRWERIGEIPLVKQVGRQAVKDVAGIYMAKLRQPKVTRPRTRKTLSSAIKAHFRDAVDESDIPKVVAAMESAGFISIENDKVTYTTDSPAAGPA